jgi:hypothetical protein
MPSQEVINQKNSTANAEQVSESNLEARSVRNKRTEPLLPAKRLGVDVPVSSLSCPLVRKKGRWPAG